MADSAHLPSTRSGAIEASHLRVRARRRFTSSRSWRSPSSSSAASAERKSLMSWPTRFVDVEFQNQRIGFVYQYPHEVIASAFDDFREVEVSMCLEVVWRRSRTATILDFGRKQDIEETALCRDLLQAFLLSPEGFRFVARYVRDGCQTIWAIFPKGTPRLSYRHALDSTKRESSRTKTASTCHSALSRGR